MNIRDFLEQSQNLAIEQAERIERQDMEKWQKIADDLAWALDCLVDDKDNMKFWFKAHDALKQYGEAKK